MSDAMRDELLGLEEMTGEAALRYRAELHELMNRKLTTAGRVRYFAPALGGAAAALMLTALAISEPESTPFGTRIALLVMAGVGVTWAFLAGRVLRRGSVDLVKDRRAFANAALFFTVAQAGFFAWRAADSAEAVPGFLLSLVFMVLATGLFLAQRIRESELRVREQHLRMELNRGQ